MSPKTRPRVALVTAYYHPVVGGVEHHARQLATYWHRRGFEVLILTKKLTRGEPAWTEIDGIPVHRVPPAGPRAFSAKWLMVPFLLWALVGLRRRYDVIYSPDYRGVGIAAIVAGRLLGHPFIAGAGATGVLSGSNWSGRVGPWRIDRDGVVGRALRAPVRWIYSQADHYTCITREMVEEALSCGIAPDRVHYLPNSVDVRRFRPSDAHERNAIRRDLGWPVDRPICLFMARLSVEKGLLDLVEAWRHVSQAGALLQVVGPDMPGHHLDAGGQARALTARLGLESRVSFHGPTSDAPRVLRAADVFAHPSHWEAAPFAVIEAMATGLPIVATSVGGMGEYLTDGRNALFCPPRAPSDLARQIDRLLGDAALARRLGDEARRDALRDFDEAVVCERYERLLLEAARQARPQPPHAR